MKTVKIEKIEMNLDLSSSPEGNTIKQTFHGKRRPLYFLTKLKKTAQLHFMKCLKNSSEVTRPRKRKIS